MCGDRCMRCFEFSYEVFSFMCISVMLKLVVVVFSIRLRLLNWVLVCGLFSCRLCVLN